MADLNPLIGLRDAISRKTASGAPIGSSETVTIEQALSLYTREAAYFSFEEKERGTLSAGKAADLVVLDKDPRTVSPADLPNCRVNLTVVGGKIAYEAD